MSGAISVKQVWWLLAFAMFWASNASARTTLPLYTASEITEACQSALQKARSNTLQLANSPLRNAKRTLFAWNRLQMDLEDVIGPVYLYASVHTDKAARDAGGRLLVKVQRI